MNVVSHRQFEQCLGQARFIGQQGLDVPIAVITAYGSAENAVEAMKAGAFDYLSKPVSLAQLRTLVKSVLKLDGSRPGPAVAEQIAAVQSALMGAQAGIEGIDQQISALRTAQGDAANALAEQQKAEAMDRLRATLPEDMQEMLVPQLQAELRQQTAALQAQGAAPEQIRQLRQQLVGAEATQRRIEYAITGIISSMVLMAAGLFLAWKLVRSITLPLRQGIQAAENIAQGDLSMRIAVAGSPKTRTPTRNEPTAPMPVQMV